MTTHIISQKGEQLYRVGEWEFSFLACTVRKIDPVNSESDAIKVTPRSMEVLKYLCDKPGVVICLSEIISEIWGRSTCTDHLVHKAIAELRSALSDNPSAPRYIKTVPKRGYAMIADVVLVDSQVGESPISSKSAGLSELTQADVPVSLYTDQAPDADLTARNAEISGSVPSAARRLRRTLFGDLRILAASVSFTAVLLWLFSSYSHDMPGQEDGVRLAIYPFSIAHQSAESTLVSESMAFALFHGLSKIKGIEKLMLGSSTNPVLADAGLPGNRMAGDQGRDLPTHVLRGAVAEDSGNLRVFLQLVDVGTGVQKYVGQFELSDGNLFSMQDEIVSNIASALRMQLIDGVQMTSDQWGTTDARAYEKYRSGMSYYNQFNPGDFRRAITQFQAAVNIDPEYIDAYHGIAIAANNLASAGRTDTIEEMYDLVDDVHRELMLLDADVDVLSSVQSIKQRLRGFDYYEQERYLREKILTGAPGKFPIAHYALMLIGARMYDEANRLLDSPLNKSGDGMSPDEAWSYRYNVLTPEEKVEARKMQLLEQPNHIGFLSTVATNLAFLGDYEQAGIYLDKLETLDTEGILYHRSKIMWDFFSGSYDKNPSLITEALLDNKDFNYNNGLLCFMMGNLEKGLEYWRDIPATQRRSYFNDLHRSERFIPSQIIASERYQQQLEVMGAGRQWQRRLMEGIMQMSEVTGVDLNENSMNAYYENALMSQNNLWSETDWNGFNAHKQITPTLISVTGPESSE